MHPLTQICWYSFFAAVYMTGVAIGYTFGPALLALLHH